MNTLHRSVIVLLSLFFVSVLHAAQFILTWVDHASNEDGFMIERAAGSGPFTQIATIGAVSGTGGTGTYVDSGLPAGSTFSYRVRAFNSAGNSGYSNVATGTTPAAVAPPDGAPDGAAVAAPFELVNISTRSDTVAPGSNLTGGFVVKGSAGSVLIRGIGPALAGLGIPGAMTDPRISLMSGQTVIATNDDWSGQAIADAAASTGAFPLTAGSKDAALLVTLAPGAYTVILTGAAGSGGVAMVEVYKVGP